MLIYSLLDQDISESLTIAGQLHRETSETTTAEA